jgi:hypothetical protein
MEHHDSVYKPGDAPPKGYLNLHDWAEVQTKSGLVQEECWICKKWKFPQELNSVIILNDKKVVVCKGECTNENDY